MYFATVVAVVIDRVRLRFDGEDLPREKTYQFLSSAKGMRPNDRVLLWRGSGTTVVVGVIGVGEDPGPVHAATADYATKAGTADKAKEAETAAWAASADTAERATKADSVDSAPFAQEANHASSADNANYAEQCHYAQYVLNEGSTGYGIQFRTDKGKLQFRVSGMPWTDV